ncbi:AP2 domain-containing protein [Candidatus Francisella endociliophora]|uniref:AP2 domain-containing protein n=1 Tax=Candidatus Francisella endociliophora TaxID=653937 RepID=UPI0006932203|nr:AP2 domain-containing protein [Francisella sp. FSC1006]
MLRKVEVKAGDKYGRLTIIKEVETHIQPSGQKCRKVLAKCVCGSKKEYRLPDLRSGLTTSCGCYRIERISTPRQKYGLRKHPLCNTYYNLMYRCYNSKAINYKYYGGRGITVCDEWRNDFKTFYDWCMDNGYKKGLQIDRIDNDGNYEPSNCRFVTPSDNMLNTRVTGKVKYRGVHFDKYNNKYKSYISINSRSKYIGRYATDIEAAKAYDKYVIDNNLPNKLNFT